MSCSVSSRHTASRGDGTDEWEGTIGYALHPDAQGRGFAAEAAAELLVIGFRDLGLRRITADAYADNIASNRVLRRIGMRHEATIRREVLGQGRHLARRQHLGAAPRRVARLTDG